MIVSIFVNLNVLNSDVKSSNGALIEFHVLLSIAGRLRARSLSRQGGELPGVHWWVRSISISHDSNPYTLSRLVFWLRSLQIICVNPSNEKGSFIWVFFLESNDQVDTVANVCCCYTDEVIVFIIRIFISKCIHNLSVQRAREGGAPASLGAARLMLPFYTVSYEYYPPFIDCLRSRMIKC